jgi:hypothetical protein
MRLLLIEKFYIPDFQRSREFLLWAPFGAVFPSQVPQIIFVQSN